MTEVPPPRWGEPTAPTGPRVPLPPRARFEPSALLTSPVPARRLRSALGAQVRQAQPERRRRLAELAEIGEGVVVLRTREFDRALDRLAAPAASATSRGAVVVTLAGDGPALAAERADSLPIALWSDVAGVEVGTVAHGPHRVRVAVLSVLVPHAAPVAGFRGLARASLAARRRRTVLVPLVVASPGPLGWGVADDRAFLFALDRLRRAHEGGAR